MNNLSRIGVYYRDTRASLFYLRVYDFLFFFFFLVELKVIKRIVTITSRGEAELEGYVSSKSKKR